MTVERHYKSKEVADLLAIHPDTVLRLAQRQELKSVRIGNERRYPESAIQEFLDKHTEGRSVARVTQLRRRRA